jgi:hypothetical protein
MGCNRIIMKHNQKMSMGKHKLIAEIRRKVPMPRLVGAMAAVFQARRERAGLDPDNFEISEPEKQLDAFMQSCSIQQLRMLREIAEGLTLESVDKVNTSRH